MEHPDIVRVPENNVVYGDIVQAVSNELVSLTLSQGDRCVLIEKDSSNHTIHPGMTRTSNYPELILTCINRDLFDLHHGGKIIS